MAGAILKPGWISGASCNAQPTATASLRDVDGNPPRHPKAAMPDLNPAFRSSLSTSSPLHRPPSGIATNHSIGGCEVLSHWFQPGLVSTSTRRRSLSSWDNFK
jgi:hypothetical protein